MQGDVRVLDFLVPGNRDVYRGKADPDQAEWLDRQENADSMTDLIR